MNSKIKYSARASRFSLADLVWSATAACAVFACGGSELEQRDLGNTNAASAPDGNERTPLVTPDGVDTFVAGRWLGHAEDLFSAAGPNGERPTYNFPSGSQEIALELSIDDAVFQDLLGRIVFGQGPVPEPAPGAVYPPGIHPNGAADLAAIPPIEGFVYTASRYGDSSSLQGAIGISYSPGQPYENWCPLQPAVSTSSGFDCVTPSPAPDPLPPTGWCTDRETARTRHYDCRLSFLCQACNCTANGCTAAYAEAVQLWLIRSGDALLGTFARAAFDYGDDLSYLPIGNVRFERQEP